MGCAYQHQPRGQSRPFLNEVQPKGRGTGVVAQRARRDKINRGRQRRVGVWYVAVTGAGPGGSAEARRREVKQIDGGGRRKLEPAAKDPRQRGPGCGELAFSSAKTQQWQCLSSFLSPIALLLRPGLTVAPLPPNPPAPGWCPRKAPTTGAQSPERETRPTAGTGAVNHFGRETTPQDKKAANITTTRPRPKQHLENKSTKFKKRAVRLTSAGAGGAHRCSSSAGAQ